MWKAGTDIYTQPLGKDWENYWFQALRNHSRGALVTQSGKCPTSAQVMISWFVGSSLTSGSLLSVYQRRVWSLLQTLCLPLSVPLPCSGSVSKINKCKKKKKKKSLYIIIQPLN